MAIFGINSLDFWGVTSRILILVYTWNLFVLYFWASTLQNKALSNKNKGHLGSRFVFLCTVDGLLDEMGPPYGP